jgi:pyruvate carboxylase subunit B
MKKIDFMLTAFRDGLQSAFGSRVLSADYLPIVEACSKAGISHFESGGGALFQSAYFYCNEDAFAVMDGFRQAAGPGATLQTLSRGVYLLGLEGQGSDVIKLHASLMKKHGVDIVRNFDALNDVDNLRYSGSCIRAAGLKHELAIAMMELPPESPAVRGPEFYLSVLKRLMDGGVDFDSLCFKDASGTCTPRLVHDVVKGARKILGSKMRIVFHGHDTAGLGVEACMGAIEAGIDQVDLSMAPCSGGTCQPDILSLWHALRGTEYSLDIDTSKIIAVEERFKDALKDYYLPPEATRVEPLVSFFPMPGGALTSNTQMLRDNGLIDRYPEVVKAMGEAIVKGGMGTSATPVSQFYFQQAFNNVMYGPWTRIADGYGKMVLGYFGRTPEEPDPEVKRLAVAQLNLPPTTASPLEIVDRDPRQGIQAARAVLEAEGLPVTDENVFISAICHEKGTLFLKGGARSLVDKGGSQGGRCAEPKAPAQRSDELTVRINNRAYGVKFSGDQVTVNGVMYTVQVASGIDADALARTAVLPKGADAPAISTTTAVDSPLSGILTRLYKKPGDKVAVGETVMVIDAMGVEVPVNSRFSGIVQDVFVHLGEQVEAGSPLFRLSTIVHGSERTVSHAAEAHIVEKGRVSEMTSPIAGLVLRIYKEGGERVRSGESVLVLESMKMETPVNCPIEGVIDSIEVKRGDIIREGAILAKVTKKREDR